MNMRQDRDLAIQWDMVCRKLKGTGADLSKIKIKLKDERTTSYITRKIMEGLKEEQE